MADAPCGGCGKRMGDGEYVEVLGKEYHAECFKCALCQRMFGERERYVEHEGKPVHDACIPKKSTSTPVNADDICFQCKKVIAPGTEYLKLKHDGEKFYHTNCVVCTRCKKPIGSLKYALDHGNVVHESCTGGAVGIGSKEVAGAATEFSEELTCTGCKQPIRGQKKVVPGFGTFHLSGCFKCTQCNLGITKEAYKNEAGGAICHRCNK